jgi:hypothetical protein
VLVEKSVVAERGDGLGANDTVGAQAVCLLKGTNGLLCAGTKEAIDGKVIDAGRRKTALQLLNRCAGHATSQDCEFLLAGQDVGLQRGNENLGLGEISCAGTQTVTAAVDDLGDSRQVIFVG